MDNLQDYEDKAYSAAETIVYTRSQLFQIYYQLIKFSLQGVLAIISSFLNILFEFVIPPKPKSIAGQLALVTGGANGLGREIARCLAKEKCNIVICDLDIENAEKTAKEIESEFGVTTKAYKVDVSDFEAVDNLKKSIEADVGFVDILVNNAGVMAITSLREGKPSDYKKIFDINVMSSFWVNKLFCLSFSGQLI